MLYFDGYGAEAMLVGYALGYQGSAETGLAQAPEFVQQATTPEGLQYGDRLADAEALYPGLEFDDYVIQSFDALYQTGTGLHLRESSDHIVLVSAGQPSC